jgi:hypothetical protein
MKQVDTRQVWQARVSAYRASGQNASEWCVAQQLTTRQLWYWLRKFKQTDALATPPSRWVTISVDKQQPELTETTLIVKVGSAAIEVRPGYNSTLLSDIVKTLQAIC